jgi:hypothetical protein
MKVHVTVENAEWECDGVAFEDHPHPGHFDTIYDLPGFELLMDDLAKEAAIHERMCDEGLCLVEGNLSFYEVVEETAELTSKRAERQKKIDSLIEW